MPLVRAATEGVDLLYDSITGDMGEILVKGAGKTAATAGIKRIKENIVFDSQMVNESEYY